MAKGSGAAGAKVAKGANKPKGPPHIHARIAYLDQISNYLASHLSSAVQDPGRIANQIAPDAAASTAPAQHCDPDPDTTMAPPASEVSLANSGLPYLLGAHLRAVSRKGQIPLSRDVKRSLCKRCNGRLIPEQTSIKYLENRSKGGKKPHANVEVLRCLNCRVDKRFPTGAQRQQRKSERESPQTEKDETVHVVAFRAP